MDLPIPALPLVWFLWLGSGGELYFLLAGAGTEQLAPADLYRQIKANIAVVYHAVRSHIGDNQLILLCEQATSEHVRS